MQGNGATLRSLNEASYPVYVLHMPILTAMGFYLVQWRLPLEIACFCLLIAIAGVTFGVYASIVRRIPLCSAFSSASNHLATLRALTPGQNGYRARQMRSHDQRLDADRRDGEIHDQFLANGIDLVTYQRL